MASERKFIKRALTESAVKDYLNKELERAGVSSIQLQKTPVATRISIQVRRPGVVVGKGGRTIQQVTETLQNQYGIDNPQLEVIEVANPILDARLVAERVAHQIEIKGNAKRVARFALQEIMEAGAIGAEIRIAGKIVGKGGKAKTVKVRAGYLKKSGEPMKLVKEGRFVAYPKAGAIGVKVRIVPPGTIFPDQITIPDLQLPTVPVAGAPGAPEGVSPVQGLIATPTESTLPAQDEKIIAEKIEQAKEAKVKRTRKKATKTETSQAGVVAQITGVAPKPEPAAETPAAVAA